MNKEELIRMAREAGFADSNGVVHPAYQLEAFANLVAAAEREACLDAMMQSTTKAVDTAMALEREACAKLCEAQDEYGWQQYADAIRARGNT